MNVRITETTALDGETTWTVEKLLWFGVWEEVYSPAAHTHRFQVKAEAIEFYKKVKEFNGKQTKTRILDKEDIAMHNLTQ